MTADAGHGGSPSHEVPDYWWYQARSNLLQASLSSFAVGAGRALDLGSADGPSAAWLRQEIGQVASLDIDPRGLGPNGVCGSALALPFADESVDLVSAFDVLEHLEPEADALQEVHRVMRPGGVLLLSVPAYQWAWTDFDIANGHVRRYTRARAVAAVNLAGFVVDRATYGFSAVFPMFVAERAARRLRRPRHSGPVATVSVPAVSRPLHTLLMGLSAIDSTVLQRYDLPFGSSIFLAAHKPDA